MARKLMAVVLASIIALTAYAADKQPDFAFPRQVSTDALTRFNHAVAHNEAPKALRAAIDYALAQGAISSQQLPAAVAMIDSAASRSNDPTMQAMLTLLNARLRSEMRNALGRRINNRDLPLLPLPEDMNQWDTKQFRYSLLQSIAAVMRHADALKQVRLNQWSDVVTHTKETFTYYPTLYDFAAEQCINLLGGYANTGTEINDLYSQWLDFHPEASAPRVWIEINRLRADAPSDLTKSMTELYRRYADLTPYALDILCELPADAEHYTLFKEAVNAHPDYAHINTLRNALTEITAPLLDLYAPNSVYPGVQTAITYRNTNVKRGEVRVYRLPESASAASTVYRFSTAMPPKLIATLPIEDSRDVPFTDADTLTYTFTEAGRHILVPVIEGQSIKDKTNYDIVYCTRLAPLTMRTGEQSTMIYALDGMTGAPMPGVNVFTKKGKAGTTGEDGSLTVPSKQGLTLWLQEGKNMTPTFWSIINPYYAPDTEALRAKVIPSLPLYHPGDTVRFVAIVYNLLNTVEGREVTVTLHDANFQKVDSVLGMTDALGRVHSELVIPNDGRLLGEYSLIVSRNNEALGRGSIQVSDYKLPSFLIEKTVAQSDVPSRGDVTISGRAMTYSGTPLQDAKVSISISSAPPYFFFGRRADNPFLSVDTITGFSGDFQAVIPSKPLNGCEHPNGVFTAQVTITSATGESHSIDITFTRTAQYTISAEIPSAINVNEPFTPVIRITEADGKESVIPLVLDIVRNDTIIASFTEQKTIDLSSINPGRAIIKIRPQDAALAQEQEYSTVLYNPKDSVSPVDDAIWTPVNTLEISGESASLPIWTPGETTLFMVIVQRDRALERKTIPLKEGLNRVDISLPKGVQQAEMQLSALRNFKGTTLTVNAVRVPQPEKFAIEIASFRDKVRPLDMETWTITVSPTAGDSAAVVIDMYNAALQAIVPGYMQDNSAFRLGIAEPYRNSSYISFFNNPINHTAAYITPKRLKTLSLQTMVPEWNTYDRSFAPYRGGGIMFRSMATTNLMADMAAEVYVEEEVAVGAAMPKSGNIESRDNSIQTVEQQPFAYRDSEVALALFRPDLTTSPDGRVVLSFRVPNANAQWVVDLFGWTRSLQSASVTQRITAAKPVMVRPNYPRFLRAGDKVTIPVTTVNNTDERVTAKSVIEALNALNDSVIAVNEVDLSIPAKESRTASLTFTVPTGLQGITVRAKSSTEGYADGEQTVIPVLPAEQVTVTSDNFYIAPGQSNYTAELPKVNPRAEVSLNYTSGPIWTIVEALPSLSTESSVTAPEAAMALYGAATSRSILKDHPEIADALKQLKSAESSLQVEADMKLLLLNATPWVSAGATDRERLNALAAMLDDDVVSRVINDAISTLKRLQSSDGGWLWTERSDTPDKWSTTIVLSALADLEAQGSMPTDNDLSAMLRKGTEWLDNKTFAEYEKTPNGNFTDYAYLRTRLTSVPISEKAERVVSATAQQLTGRWQNLSVGEKARAAMILNARNDHRTAMTILESIGEYAESTPAKGMWWPSLTDEWYNSLNANAITAEILRTYASVEPTSTQIDPIRQWLILQKQGQLWGNNRSTMAIVASILLTDKVPLRTPLLPQIRVDGKDMPIESGEGYAGQIDLTIASPRSNSTVEIVRTDAEGPAYGAILTRTVMPLSDITSQSCDGLSIEKRLLVVDGDSVIAAGADIPLGARVRVLLTVKCTKQLDYVTISDERAAGFEPVDQLPGMTYCDGAAFYRVNGNSTTRLFIDRLRVGTYQITYDLWANNSGTFSSGAATIQSQLTPAMTARSGGGRVEIRP